MTDPFLPPAGNGTEPAAAPGAETPVNGTEPAANGTEPAGNGTEPTGPLAGMST